MPYISRHLKESDDLFDFVRSLVLGGHETPLSVQDAFEMTQHLIDEHMAQPAGSRLRKYCPRIGSFFVRLDLLSALEAYDQTTHLTKRRYVPPTFSEVRRIFNLSSVYAIASKVKLITLDADDTIYSDGGSVTVDSPMVPIITKLLRMGCHVSLVTAAGYPGEPHKFEARVAGLLRSLAFAIECGAPIDFVKRFHIMGGECNYLLEPEVETSVDGLGPRVYLKEIPDAEWKDGRGVRWEHHEVQKLLDTAEACLRETAELLGLSVLVIRKPRSVGIISNPATAAQGIASTILSYEVLEECAIAVQERLKESGITIPHCAFNGGHDVFIDVGHKALGITALQARVGVEPDETVHAGDRFTRTGNDLRARDVANTLWVDSPAETEYLLSALIQNKRLAMAAETCDTSATAAAGGAPQHETPVHTPFVSVPVSVELGIPPGDMNVPFEPTANGSAVSAANGSATPFDAGIGLVSGPTPTFTPTPTPTPTSPPADAGLGKTASGRVIPCAVSFSTAPTTNMVIRTPVMGANAVASPTDDMAAFSLGEPTEAAVRVATATAAAAPSSHSGMPAEHAAPFARSMSAPTLNDGSAGGAESTPRGRGVTSGIHDALPTLYGMSMPRNQKGWSQMNDTLRSMWESAGGKVVAEVRLAHPASKQARPPASGGGSGA